MRHEAGGLSSSEEHSATWYTSMVRALFGVRNSSVRWSWVPRASSSTAVYRAGVGHARRTSKRNFFNGFNSSDGTDFFYSMGTSAIGANWEATQRDCKRVVHGLAR